MYTAFHSKLTISFDIYILYRYLPSFNFNFNLILTDRNVKQKLQSAHHTVRAVTHSKTQLGTTQMICCMAQKSVYREQHLVPRVDWHFTGCFFLGIHLSCFLSLE